MTSPSAIEAEHLLRSKFYELFTDLAFVLDEEQYRIVTDILEKEALPKVVDKLFELDDKRVVGIPDKILCLSCKNLIEPDVKRFRKGEMHNIRLGWVSCKRYSEQVPCHVDCYKYEPKP